MSKDYTRLRGTGATNGYNVWTPESTRRESAMLLSGMGWTWAAGALRATSILVKGLSVVTCVVCVKVEGGFSVFL